MTPGGSELPALWLDHNLSKITRTCQALCSPAFPDFPAGETPGPEVRPDSALWGASPCLPFYVAQSNHWRNGLFPAHLPSQEAPRGSSGAPHLRGGSRQGPACQRHREDGLSDWGSEGARGTDRDFLGLQAPGLAQLSLALCPCAGPLLP